VAIVRAAPRRRSGDLMILVKGGRILRGEARERLARADALR
jgi:hypothetical protein